MGRVFGPKRRSPGRRSRLQARVRLQGSQAWTYETRSVDLCRELEPHRRPRITLNPSNWAPTSPFSFTGRSDRCFHEMAGAADAQVVTPCREVAPVGFFGSEVLDVRESHSPQVPFECRRIEERH